MSVQLIRVGLVVTNSICRFDWVREDQVFDQTFHLACRPGKDNLPLRCELTSPNPNEICKELQFRRSSFSLSSWEGGTCHCLLPVGHWILDSEHGLHYCHFSSWLSKFRINYVTGFPVLLP